MLNQTKLSNFNEKQHKHLLNVVSRNFEITMKEIKSIKIEVNDLLNLLSKLNLLELK